MLVNAKLAAGIPINLPKGLDIENPQCSLQTGYLEIAADITYTPSSEIVEHEMEQQVDARAEKVASIMQRVKSLKVQIENLEKELHQLFAVPQEENAIRMN